MKDENGLKGFAKLKNDMQGMTWKKKLEHLWTYYRWIPVVAVALVMLVALLVRSYININTETLLSGVAINLEPDTVAHAFLTDEFQEKYTTGVRWEKTRLQEVDLESFSETTDFQTNEYKRTSILALCAGKELDYVLADEVGLQSMWPAGDTDDAFLELTEFFTEEEMAQFAAQDRLAYFKYQNEDTEDARPMAVDVSGLPFIKEHFKGQFDGPVFFCVVINTPRMEQVRTLWNDMNNWEAE